MSTVMRLFLVAMLVSVPTLAGLMAWVAFGHWIAVVVATAGAGVLLMWLIGDAEMSL